MMMFHKNNTILSIVITLCTVVNNCNCMSVVVLSNGHNFTKRETKASDFYPDWVPFKNKRGDELGEFTEVTRKSNLKKRLALPANFRFSAIDTEGEDYFDKVGNEGEDDFEKRDWSDLHRTPGDDVKKLVINHKALEHVDGIMLKVNPTTVITPSLHDFNENTRSEEKHLLTSDLPKFESSIGTIAPPKKTQTQEIKNKSGEQRVVEKNLPTKYEDEIEYEDGYSAKTKKRTPEIVENDENENNERRHKILDLVDDLKEQHEAKQRLISEKMKEEELSREEHDQNYGSVGYDKYSNPIVPKKLPLTFEEYDVLGPEDDKYKVHREIGKSNSASSIILPATIPTTTQKNRKKSHVVETGKLSFFRNPSLFMVYDDEDSDELPDSIRAIQNLTSTESDYVTTDVTSPLTTPKSTTPFESDDEVITTTTQSTTNEQYVYTAPWTSKLSQKFDNILTRKSTEAPDRKTERISLVPISPNHDDSEPALFFPKPRKVKSKNKGTSKIKLFEVEASPLSALDITGPSAEAQNISDNLSSTSDKPESSEFGTAPSGSDDAVTRPTYIDTSPNFTIKQPEPFSTGKSNVKIISNKVIYRGSNEKHVFPSSVVTAPSTVDSVPSAADTAPSAVSSSVDKSSESDAVPAPSESEAEAHKPTNHEHESGGGHEHKSEHEEEKSEHGKKAYEGFHKDSKVGKGHHNKEDHLGKYHDHGGFDKHHHDESGHQGEHLHEEHGKKHAQYEESGKHSKGHNTKGSHDIHKKDEYEKKVEFFEEEGDSIEEEKHGGYHKDREHKRGGSFLKGRHNSAREKLKKGETGRYEKLLNHKKHKGHKGASGHDSHGKHGASIANSNSGAGGKHWIYHHGSPPKNANLVIIDRRDGFVLPVQNYG